MARKLSFKRGTVAQKARSNVAESIKRSGTKGNPFAIATAATKRMSRSKRSKLAKRR